MRNPYGDWTQPFESAACSWTDEGHGTVVDLTGLATKDSNAGFLYRSYSVPRDDPVHNAPNVQELYDAIWQQMTFWHVVIILASKYATFSRWIDREIQCAKADLRKPVLAVGPWGSEQVSSVVRENADLLVNWSTDSIISGMRQIAL